MTVIDKFFFSSRRRHTRFDCDWSSDVCSSDLVERDFGDDLGADVHGVVVASDLDLEEFLGLPGEHLVGQSLERLAEHHESAAFGVARAQMQIAQRAAAPAAAPLRGEDDEIEL